ncbi:mechanosensitive ion channel family protein [Vallitalea okinawensis]|uniref:mechanosensitive ion channel family protein n=1 Tax=Vallitalea okinawensis TaxID=2078660 RepID=UPI000CFC0C99|nr:mechanosensitive ion channel family protein [Vallitalea okinawensis]
MDQNVMVEFFENIGIGNIELNSNLVISIILILSIWIINRVLIKITHKYMENVQRFYYVKKLINYSSITILLIVLISIWLMSGQSMTTFLGLLSAGFAIALKDLLINFAGWLFIILKKPFEVGDRIEINNSAGDVIDQRIFQFTIIEIGNWVDGDQSTGRLIHVPNSKVFTDNLANFTKAFQFIWSEMSVIITFESDWQKAKKILLEIVDNKEISIIDDAKSQIKEASLKYMIMYKNLTPIVYTSIEDYGIKLTIRYLCDPRNRRSSRHAIYEKILLAFNEEMDIEFAYPTQKIYFNDK